MSINAQIEVIVTHHKLFVCITLYTYKYIAISLMIIMCLFADITFTTLTLQCG